MMMSLGSQLAVNSGETSSRGQTGRVCSASLHSSFPSTSRAHPPAAHQLQHAPRGRQVQCSAILQPLQMQANSDTGSRSSVQLLSAGEQRQSQTVTVTVERGDQNSRRLFAGIDIAAPAPTVWRALTDYDNLDTFIPGLAENRCLNRSTGGCTLLQVGEQEVALGAKFRARVVLDIQEHPMGIPQSWLGTPGSGNGVWSPFGSSKNGNGNGGLTGEDAFPAPRSTLPTAVRDISFKMVAGDFQAFQGVWRIQQGAGGPDTTRLSYSLFVRPQIWLPVRLIQNRIEGEVVTNLCAVRAFAEDGTVLSR